MPLPQEKYYTAEEFYNLPDEIHAELINGEIVYMAAPSTIHQIISSELHFAINSYIKSKAGHCRALAAPFGVQLHKGEDTVLEPDISVICDTDKITPEAVPALLTGSSRSCPLPIPDMTTSPNLDCITMQVFVNTGSLMRSTGKSTYIIWIMTI